MRLRFHSVLILLLVFFVMGAGMQGAMCDLLCGLGGRVPCHGAAPVAKPSAATNDAVAGMHCSGMKSSGAAEDVASSLHFDSGAMGLCRHPASVATVSGDPARENDAAVHWVVVQPMPMQLCPRADRSSANANALPLRSRADTLPVTLRV